MLGAKLPQAGSACSRQLAARPLIAPATLSSIRSVESTCCSFRVSQDHVQPTAVAFPRNVTAFAKSKNNPGPSSDWDAALTSDFPAAKLKDDDELVDDVLDAGFEETAISDPSALLRASIIHDEDGGEGEEEFPDEDEVTEGEEEDEDEFGEDFASVAVSNVEVENVDYDTISRERVKKLGERAEIIEVTDQEMERMERVRAAEEASKASALARAEESRAAMNRQGYMAFDMGDVELLVAETPDGKLDLADSYVFELEAGLYARPGLSSNSVGGLPELPQLYQCIPWMERRSPDTLKRKDAVTKMRKIIFVGVQSQHPYRVQLSEVYTFDAGSRTMCRPEVRTVGTNIADPILRIRPEGITIEDSGAAPRPVEVSMNWNMEDIEHSMPRSTLSEEELEAAKQERMDELEAQAELEKLDDTPDVGSASDLL